MILIQETFTLLPQRFDAKFCVFQKLARYLLLQADDAPGGSSPSDAVILELAEVRVLQSVFSGCPMSDRQSSPLPLVEEFRGSALIGRELP